MELPKGLEPSSVWICNPVRNQFRHGSVVPAARLELATYPLWRDGSNQLSYTGVLISTVFDIENLSERSWTALY